MRSKVKCKSGHCLLQYTYRLSAWTDSVSDSGILCAMTSKRQQWRFHVYRSHTPSYLITAIKSKNEWNFLSNFFLLKHLYKRIVHESKWWNARKSITKHLQDGIKLNEGSTRKLRIQDDLKLTMSIRNHSMLTYTFEFSFWRPLQNSIHLPHSTYAKRTWLIDAG